MIPANIDYQAIIQDLIGFGFGPYKIDLVCGFYEGATSDLMTGRSREMGYQRSARLYNFWWDERQRRGLHVLTSSVPLFPGYSPAALATT